MVSALKSRIKAVLPASVVRFYQQKRVARIRRINEEMSTKEVFTRIYREKRWSVSSHSEFQSGSGSGEILAEAYSKFVTDFVKDRSVLSIVDLGCGDFNIGKRIAGGGLTYIGVDIVEDLIAHHNAKFGDDEIEFRCLDIIEDDLPQGELCLVRQVFQHLSNREILRVLPKLAAYKYVLISEHYPAGDLCATPNIDKPHGEDTRLFDNSAVYLDHPPFSLENVTTVFSIDAPSVVADGETIRTILIDNTINT